MENIYKETAKAVYFGAPFSVDFKRRSLTVDGEKIISDGSYIGGLGMPVMPVEEFLQKAEDLYAQYKRSIPGKSSTSNRRPYFRAVKLDELTEEDLVQSPWREHARARLEVFILCCLLNGSFSPIDFFGQKWFWQSEREPMFVLRRGMFTNETRKGKAAQ